MGLISRVSSRTYRPSKKHKILKMPLAIDLANPTLASEKQRHKKKRLVQTPNSFFMDVKCRACIRIKTIFSHVQTPVYCHACNTLLASPTGGKAKLTTGCSYRKKQNH